MPPTYSDSEAQASTTGSPMGAPGPRDAAVLKADGSALGSAPAWLRLALVTGLGITLDLWSKAWAFTGLQSQEVWTIIPGVLSFRRSLNPGALFGWGKGLVPVFIAASLVALGFVLYLFACSRRRQRGLHVALGMILAGAVGNLYDRAFIKADMVSWRSQPGRSFIGKQVSPPGAEPLVVGEYPDGAPPHLPPADDMVVRPIGVVRDFIKIELEIRGREIWPWVFNVADSLLVVGVGMLLIEFWLDHRRARRTARSRAAA